MPKRGGSEPDEASNFRGLSENCSQKPIFERLFFLEFSGRGRKSGSAFALVDLAVSLAPLVVMIPNFQTVTDSGNGTSEALKFKLHLNSRIYKSIFNCVSHKNEQITS